MTTEEKADKIFNEMHQILTKSKYGMNDPYARKKILALLVGQLDLQVIKKNSDTITWYKPGKQPKLNERIFIITDNERITTGFTQQDDKGETHWLDDSYINRINKNKILLWAYQPDLEKHLQAIFSL